MKIDNSGKGVYPTQIETIDFGAGTTPVGACPLDTQPGMVTVGSESVFRNSEKTGTIMEPTPPIRDREGIMITSGEESEGENTDA